MTDAPPDPAAILRSRSFVVLLVLAAAIGIIVSIAGWLFLEAVHDIQVWVFQDLPSGLGFDTAPTWWALPICTLAGIPVAFAIAKLPGEGGHVPANGLTVGGSNDPVNLPGVVLAALATLGLGLVLGPEAPLIALGSGLAVYVVKQAKKDAPPTLLLVIGAAGAFAAISVIFGSPIVAAILIIEASGLGGPTLPLIIIPGLISAGIGSLVFVGLANFSGLNTTAYSLPALKLTDFGSPTLGQIGWTIALGLAAAIITLPIRAIGKRVATRVPGHAFVVVPIAGFVVAGLAFVFAQYTSQSTSFVLFSGQDSLGTLVQNASVYSVGTLLAIVVFKSLAWAVSLGSFRGGPTFPAMFIGAAGAIAASHLPGLPMSAAIGVGIGAMIVAFLRLPLSAIVIAVVLTPTAGPGAAPLIIVGVVTAYVATLGLEGRLGAAKHTEADPLATSGSRAEAVLVDVRCGAVGAADVGVVVREHAVGAFEAGHDPRVDHPRGALHERALDFVALRLGHVAVGRERDFDAALAEHDARVRVPVPMIVRTGEAFGRVHAVTEVHQADQPRRRTRAVVDVRTGVRRIELADCAADVDEVRAEQRRELAGKNQAGFLRVRNRRILHRRGTRGNELRREQCARRGGERAIGDADFLRFVGVARSGCDALDAIRGDAGVAVGGGAAVFTIVLVVECDAPAA